MLQGRTNIHQPPLPIFTFGRADFNAASDTKHLAPIKPQCFLQTQPGKCLERDNCPHLVIGIFQQSTEFIRTVEIYWSGIHRLVLQSISFKQSVVGC